MRQMDDAWGRRRRIDNERAIGPVVLIVALLLVAAEISGMLGYW